MTTIFEHQNKLTLFIKDKQLSTAHKWKHTMPFWPPGGTVIFVRVAAFSGLLWSILDVEQERADTFCKRPDGKYITLCKEATWSVSQLLSFAIVALFKSNFIYKNKYRLDLAHGLKFFADP